MYPVQGALSFVVSWNTTVRSPVQFRSSVVVRRRGPGASSLVTSTCMASWVPPGALPP